MPGSAGGERVVRYVYEFVFSDGARREFAVELDHATLALRQAPRPELPTWTRLEYHQCPGCPLDPAHCPDCPVAASVVDVVEAFRDRKSFEEVDVRVQAASRDYHRRVPLQQAISSLLGIFMVSAGCPVLDRMRPMLDTHLPFMSSEESSFRMISSYLMAQFFIARSGGRADWKLKRFVAHLRQVRGTNAAFCARLRSLGIRDASLNAVDTLNALGELTAIALETEDLERWQRLFLEHYREDV